ncbi:hypothetical protein [Krasilnikovia sp. MM14-A1004]|uniref:hypothetical protein n=1 Tax=Krasilnikovia sp. MM14-A1004 TaxID=3373541 RepID=UPI00399D076A
MNAVAIGLGSLRALRSAMRRGPAVTARFGGVLDGRTLNLDLPVPGIAAADVTSAEIRIRRGLSTHAVQARVRSDVGGSCAVAATALLAGGARGLGLQSGAPWLVDLVVWTGGRPRSYAVLAADPAAAVDGPTLAAPPDPVTGWRYEIRAGRTRRLCLQAVPPGPTAEVTAVHVDWLEASFAVRVLGGAQAGGRVEFTARTGEGRTTATTEPAPDGVRCRIPLRELAFRGGEKETFFDVHLRTGKQRLRVGRFLHDVSAPKTVLVPPTGIVWADHGLAVQLRPYYTPAGNFTIACRPLGSLSANGVS